MSGCVFCAIAAGREGCYRVLDDEHTVAFLDIEPASAGHTLVIPRLHARDIWELDEEGHAAVARMVRRVAVLQREALGPDGVNVVHSSGAAAWQEVFHFHVHVVPRWHGDALVPPWRSRPVPREELERVRQRLAAAG